VVSIDRSYSRVRLDEKIGRLMLEKSKLAAALRSPEHEDFVDASVRQFCANAKARLTCTDEDGKRSFLVDHIERVIYDHYEVTVIGSVPVQTTTGASKLPFRIQATVNVKKVRSEAQRKAALTRFEPESRVPPKRNPTTGIARCCARAANGLTAAAPPRSVMNSRRRIRDLPRWIREAYPGRGCVGTG
jgi:hypothetical protein